MTKLLISFFFNRYIQLVSDVIRRLNRLMLCRSTCPIIESCLNIVADGLEFIFDTKTEVRFILKRNKKSLILIYLVFIGN
jgi:hypothetical protein